MALADRRRWSAPATAVLIGAPALRLPGLMLAVATLAFAVPVSTWLLNPDNFPALTPQEIPRPELFGHLALSSPRTFTASAWRSPPLAWLLMANLRRARAPVERSSGSATTSGPPRPTASTPCAPA